jgi:cephalosporin-C deacetylase
MSFRRRYIARIIAALVLFQAATQICSAQKIRLTPYEASGIYSIGERVGWEISSPQTAAPTGEYQYTVRKNNFSVIKTGHFDFASGSATIEVTVDEPAMVYVQVWFPGKGPSVPGVGGIADMAVGASVAPEKLRPSIPAPADFDAFWDSKIKVLKAIPENAVLTPSDSGKPDVAFATIKMDNINGTHVYGQMAEPNKSGKFPGLVIFQWASPPYPLQKHWVTDHAAKGWLTLNIEPHDVLPDQPRSYYDALPQSLKSYEKIGADDRDKNYFLQMYLADYRAVDYLAGRPDWDGKTLIVMGTSMGGQQSICVAGLNPKVTGVIVDEPAGCDLNGPLHGRRSGYPFWPSNNPKIMEAAQYFDPVNFASHVRVPSLVAMGFVDTIAPPAGVWTTFNQIQGPKEAVPMIDSPHNNLATPSQQRPYTSRSAEWLNTLVNGGNISPNEELNHSSVNDQAPALDQPIPRMDKNSQTAHAQLLEKARKGKISVYFEGDSITRRWGASDAQYRDFLANWNQNFFGWNAADFGWGGDTIQNILWRLNNGELDDVNPKIIVLLAGTNNVGHATPQGDDDARITSVTEGIRAILNVCQSKAPGASIVLMGITPRNDNMAVMPTIDRINENIAKLADGRKIRYLNINNKLADKDGKLFDDMTGPDKLHLAIKGYQIWADALKPIFTDLLGPQAKVDTAPPPTGDPSAK